MSKEKQITEPFAVRLNPKIKVELENLIREYKDQGTQGDFIKLLIETFKANELSSGISNMGADLEELNTLTSRIYSLYSNLIEKSNISRSNLKADFIDKLESRENFIVELQETLEELEKQNHIQSKQLLDSNQSNQKFLSQVEELTKRVSLDNNLIDRIAEDVEGAKELRIRNKIDTDKIKELEVSIDLINNTNKDLEETIKLNQDKLAARDTEHKREMNILRNDLESKNIKDSWKIKQDHQNEIKDLQDKNFKDREDVLNKYSERLDKVEHEKEDLKKYIEELKQRLDSNEK